MKAHLKQFNDFLDTLSESDRETFNRIVSSEEIKDTTLNTKINPKHYVSSFCVWFEGKDLEEKRSNYKFMNNLELKWRIFLDEIKRSEDIRRINSIT